MKKIIILAILLISCTAYGTELAYIEDGESGLSVTTKLNELIDFNNSVTEPTVQADDPTVSSENGIYFATTSQKMFVKDDDFLWASAVGTYTAITSGYDLTLTMSGVSGLDKVTIDGTDYTATSTITGLSGVVPITASYGDSDTLDVTGVTGSYPDYSITMDVDGSASFAFSTSAVCDSGLLTDGCFDEDPTTWTLGTNTIVDGVLNLTNSNVQSLADIVDVEKGATYRISITVASGSSGGGSFTMYNSYTNSSVDYTATTDGYFDVVILGDTAIGKLIVSYGWGAPLIDSIKVEKL